MYVCVALCPPSIVLTSPSSRASSGPRMCLLVMAVEVMGGTWVVEQPSSSLLRFYPRVMDTFSMFRVAWAQNIHLWPLFITTVFESHQWGDLPPFDHPLNWANGWCTGWKGLFPPELYVARLVLYIYARFVQQMLLKTGFQVWP